MKSLMLMISNSLQGDNGILFSLNVGMTYCLVYRKIDWTICQIYIAPTVNKNSQKQSL